MAQFLKNIELKELPEPVAKELDEPIKEWDIHQVISTLKNSRSLGPNGYVNEFYKTFKDMLIIMRYSLEPWPPLGERPQLL